MNYKKKICSLWLLVFYKVDYIDDGDRTGYYCKKRKISWILCFPLIIFYKTIINICVECINLIEYIFTYKSRWVSTKDNKYHKLSFYQKMLLVYRLNS